MHRAAQFRQEYAMRQRFYIVASVAYLVLGAVILVRGALAHVLPLIILGLVFCALGVVRLRGNTWFGGRRRA